MTMPPDAEFTFLLHLLLLDVLDHLVALATRQLLSAIELQESLDGVWIVISEALQTRRVALLLMRLVVR